MSTVFSADYREQRMTHLRRRLVNSGYRVTSQRVAVLDALVNGLSHPTADAIFEHVRKANPTTSLATVYKTLDRLKELGEVHELELGSGRHRYDAVDPKAHPHVICTKCGRIEDVRFEGAANWEQDLVAKAMQATGYVITTERLEFSGLCVSCQKAQ